MQVLDQAEKLERVDAYIMQYEVLSCAANNGWPSHLLFVLQNHVADKLGQTVDALPAANTSTDLVTSVGAVA